MNRIVFYRQEDYADCAVACTKTIINYYGKKPNSTYLKKIFYTQSDGTSIKNIVLGIKKLGYYSNAGTCVTNDLNNLKLPLLLFWNKNHYVVLYKIINNIFFILMIFS